MAKLFKEFESQFKKDVQATFPESFVYRIPDQMSGYKSASKNICDFIVFTNGTLFLLECKSHKGTSMPLEAFSQLDRMATYCNIKDVKCGVVIYFYEKHKVLYFTVNKALEISKKGERSLGLRHLGEDGVIDVPSKLKRTLMTSDYSFLVEL